MQAGLVDHRLTFREVFTFFRPHGPQADATRRWGSAFQGLDVPPKKSRTPAWLASIS